MYNIRYSICVYTYIDSYLYQVLFILLTQEYTHELIQLELPIRTARFHKHLLQYTITHHHT